MAWLVGLGVVSTVLYLAIRHLSHAFAFGAAQPGRPIPLVLTLFAILFVLYLWATKIAVLSSRPITAVWIVVVFAAGFRIILLSSEPIQEVDIYRYMWDGAVTNQGVSPFKYAPQTVMSPPAGGVLPDDLQRLVAIKRDQALAGVLERVHWQHVHTVYPPVSQAVFAAVHRITPPGSSLQQRIFVMRGVLVLFDFATIGLVLALLRLVGKPLGLVTAYAWCPLLLKECANSGHLDSIVVLITTAGLYLAVRALTVRTDHKQDRAKSWLQLLASCVVLAAGVGAKIYPIVLLPWLAALCLRRSRWSLVGPLIFVVASWFVMRPMLPPTMLGIPLGSQHATQQAAQNSGLATFTKYWEMNDFLFLICVENLKPIRPAAPAVWFTIVPDARRVSLVESGEQRFGWPPHLAPIFAARLLTATMFGLIAMGLAFVAWRENATASWLRTAFLTIAWFWLLSPTQNPWYWTWVLPLLPFARGRAWWALSGLVMVYYLRFWLEYEFPQPPVAGTAYNGTQFFDFVVTWLEYGPWFVWLAVESLPKWHRHEGLCVELGSTGNEKNTSWLDYGERRGILRG